MINSDDNFVICRKFGFLHSRVLLYRQDELCQLESNLIAMDDEDAENNPLALQSREVDDNSDEQWSRRSLIDKIDMKLRDYGETATIWTSGWI